MATTTPNDPRWTFDGRNDRYVFDDPEHHIHAVVKNHPDGSARYSIYYHWPKSEARAAESGLVGSDVQAIDLVTFIVNRRIEADNA